MMKTYNQLSQSAVYNEDEVSVSLTVCGGSYGGGSEVLVVQNTTGTLSPGAHAGSYNGQDAYNDMLITDGILNTENRRIQEVGASEYAGTERLQECNGSNNRGGV